jgi:hypothetical protein
MDGFTLAKPACERQGRNSSSSLGLTLILPSSGEEGRLTKDRQFDYLEVTSAVIGNYCKTYLDTDLSKGEVLGLMRAILSGQLESRATIRTASCVIDVEENDQFDEAMRSQPDGFLYYRYFLDIEPGEGVSRESYVQALSDLLRGLRKHGCKAVPACDFEDELPNA